jgi:hypothetical protein
LECHPALLTGLSSRWYAIKENVFKAAFQMKGFVILTAWWKLGSGHQEQEARLSPIHKRNSGFMKSSDRGLMSHLYPRSSKDLDPVN